jgi:RNA-directed DNA polymerase
MNPIFEPLFADCSFGYRPGRSPHKAMRKVWREINEGNLWILDADLKSYFDSVDQDRLVSLICEQISDGSVLRLIRSFLEAGVMVDRTWEPTRTGVPQGGVASPLWSNIYLTPFDHAMTEAGYRLTRFADDFVVICNTRQEAEAALALAKTFLQEKLGVSLHPEKTRIVHVRDGFEFLGYSVLQRRKERRGRRCRKAAWKMRAGPSGSAFRSGSQTTPSCFGPMAEVVSVGAKARGTTPSRCASERRTKVNPSMTRR